jgi:DNA-binding XRE family transcriptional regulator
MDSKYFRYLMEIKEYTPETLGRELGVSKSQMNYKILKGSFSIRDIKTLTEIFNMKFEDIFINTIMKRR